MAGKPAFLGHGDQKKKQQKNQGQDDDTLGRDAEGGSLYNSKGAL